MLSTIAVRIQVTQLDQKLDFTLLWLRYLIFLCSGACLASHCFITNPGFKIILAVLSVLSVSFFVKTVIPTFTQMLAYYKNTPLVFWMQFHIKRCLNVLFFNYYF